jgi:very-short-patch-repair endonuclease
MVISPLPEDDEDPEDESTLFEQAVFEADSVAPESQPDSKAQPSAIPIEKTDSEEIETSTLPAVDAGKCDSIDTNPELPQPPPTLEQMQEKHKDLYLQTALPLELLEARLRKISADANSAVEETGTNLLHLAFGFLQWYESTDSQTPRRAPLILAPVKLQRDKVVAGTECYRYKLIYEGEDIQANLSLREMLNQDFGLVLPDLDPDIQPEEYFRKVQVAVSSKKSWQVRRQIVLGFFHFSKLRMYLDLDPANWSSVQKLESHEVVRDLLEGREERESLPFGDDFTFQAGAKSDIHLVVDADSSQQKALEHVLQGRNLVVEGPPGTGKSQTITNLIAAALARNQTVLFVAEKLAALEVVRRNLDKAGLGDFCLELHSRKAKKKLVLEEIDRRLKQRYGPVREWNDLLKDHSSSAEKLSRLTQALQKQVTPVGEAVWTVLWKCSELRERFKGSQPADCPDALELGQEAVQARIEYLEDLSEHFKNVPSPTETPWKLIHPTKLLPSEIEPFLKSLEDLSGSLARILALASTIRDKGIGIELRSLSEVGTFSRHITSTPIPGFSAEAAYLIPEVIRPEVSKCISELGTHIARAGALRGIAGGLLGAWEPADLSGLIASLKNAMVVLGTGCTLSDLSELVSHLRTAIGDAKHIVERLPGLSQVAPRPPDNWSETTNLLRIIGFARTAPFEVVEQPWTKHLSDEIGAVIAQAREAVAQCSGERAALEEIFLFSALPSVPAITEIAYAYREHEERFFRVISSDFRAAKKAIRLFIKPSARSQKLSPWLNRLELWMREVDRLANHQDWKDQLGPLYKGLATDWARLDSVLTWIRSLRNACNSTALALWVLDHIRTLGNAQGIDVATIKRAASLDRLMPEKLIPCIPGLKSYGQLSNQRLIEMLENSFVITSKLQGCIDSSGVHPGRTLGDVESGCGALAEIIQVRAKLASPVFSERLGKLYRGLETDVETLKAVSSWAHSIKSNNLPESIKSWLLNQEAVGRCAELRQMADQLLELTKRAEDQAGQLLKWAELTTDCNFTQQQASDVNGVLSIEISKVAQGIQDCIKQRDRLSRWAEYCRLLPKARSYGLVPAVVALESGRVSPDAVGQYFLYAFYEKISNSVIASNPELSGYSRASIEKAVGRYRSRDRDILIASRRNIAHLVGQREIPAGVRRGAAGDLTELGLLEREILKKRRHVPIRKLMERASGALLGLKPCFMMSPLSVAQYLSPGDYQFDLVIMDEASQLRPEDALGAIARGKQVVVVGDPKQLPPTSFFDRLSDTDDDPDEEGLLDGTESILDVCLRTYQPACRLKWHYRSQHESLIAFSNDQFYERELLLFPSPTMDPGELGIRHHFVADGRFEGRRNMAEARQIVQQIISHGTQDKSNTLGVVAFNTTQRELIEEMLEEAGKRDFQSAQAIESLLKMKEPLFIKNLENVQGDERDVILVSYTYGPDSSGHVFQRFGPINHETGWRRLNVLVTRARKRLEVFSSMRSEDIKPGTGQAGVSAMKAYLEYAESGRWKDPGKVSDREPDSEFEVMVTSILKRHGYKCRPQVGVAGFFIDIGVQHPDRPSEFILGVECDGATYHSSKAIRDRDRLRQEILESRGWKIHRVWSTDWWMNQEVEIQRLIQEIERRKGHKLKLNDAL